MCSHKVVSRLPDVLIVIASGTYILLFILAAFTDQAAQMRPVVSRYLTTITRSSPDLLSVNQSTSTILVFPVYSDNISTGVGIIGLNRCLLRSYLLLKLYDVHSTEYFQCINSG